MRTFRSIAATAVAATVLGGCSKKAPDQPVPVNTPTVLQVENDNFSDMRIYVIRGSQRTRLGIATGKSKTSFTIPASVAFGITTLRFEAVPIGGRVATFSEEITVNQGDTLTIQISAF